jgi:ABC-type Fe3+ transport system permease subunit
MEEIAFFVVPVLITIFVFALIKGWMDARVQSRTERVKLLEEALKNPAIDRATIESLTFQLTGARGPKKPGSSPLMAIILAVGWIALFAGIGCWVFGEMTHEKDALAGGVITSIVGFGLVTYPFALRELEARRAQQ